MSDHSPDGPEKLIPTDSIRRRLSDHDASVQADADALDKDQPDLFDLDANRERALAAAKLAGRRELLNELMDDLVEVERVADEVLQTPAEQPEISPQPFPPAEVA